MKNILARLREPSTWSGLAVLAALFGVPVAHVDAVAAVAAALCSAAAVFLPESKGE